MALIKILRHFQLRLPGREEIISFEPGEREVSDVIANHWFVRDNSVPVTSAESRPAAPVGLVYAEPGPAALAKARTENPNATIVQKPTSESAPQKSAAAEKPTKAPALDPAHKAELKALGVTLDELTKQAAELGITIGEGWSPKQIHDAINSALAS